MITGNFADAEGGGISSTSTGVFTLNQSTVTQNNTNEIGGGIYLEGQSVETATINDSTISDNSAKFAGGAIYAADIELDIINSTISGNTNTGNTNNGAGIHFQGTNNGNIINSTIAHNTGGAGGIVNASGALLKIENSIVAYNENISGNSLDFQGDIYSANSILTTEFGVGAKSGPGHTVGDPLLGALQDNGGPTATHSLLAGSPAIDSGDNSLAVNSSGSPLLKDQRGFGPRIENSNVDMGAFEVGAALILSLSANDDDYTVTNPITEDETLNIPDGVSDILSNDDGSPLTIVGADNKSANDATVVVNNDGSFSYDPTSSTIIQSLNEGEMLVDTFTYSITDSTPPDGLFEVQVVSTSGNTPGTNVNNWQALWTALDGGAGPTGSVAGYDVINNTTDTEVVFDYPGTGGDYSVNNTLGTIAGDGPGGGPGPFNPSGTSGSNYSVRAKTFIKFNNAGTYTIALGSDDGRRIELTEAAPRFGAWI